MEDKYKIEKEYINKLIKLKENTNLDFKFAITDSRKIARSLVAFANTEGGKLLIGVKDNGKIAGISSEEEIYMLDAAAKLYTKPNVATNLRLWQVAEKKQVLEVIIDKDKTKTYFALNENNQWKAYLRYNDVNVLAGEVWEQVQIKKQASTQSNILFTDEDKLILLHISSERKFTFSELLKIFNYSEEVMIEKVSNFVLLQLLEMELSEHEILFQIKNQQILK